MTSANDPAFLAAVSPSREYGIDVVRFGLMLFVIIIHLNVSTSANNAFARLLLMTVCSSAVPVFFISAGYFLKAERLSTGNIVTKPFRRLVPIYLPWLILYYVYARLSGLNPHIDARYLLSGGVGYHLWFLPSLAISLILVGLLRRHAPAQVAWIVVLLFASVALLKSSYHLPLHLAGEPQRGQLFAAPLLLQIGAAFQKHQPAVSIKAAFAFVALTVGLAVAENIVLALIARTPAVAWPCNISTFLLGAAVFCAARTVKSHRIPLALIAASRLTLGVYAIHLLIIYIFANSLQSHSILVTALAIFTLSVTATILIDNVPGLRRFVS